MEATERESTYYGVSDYNEIRELMKDLYTSKSNINYRKMSNIKTTFWLEIIVFPDECNIDILFREDQFCVQISAPDGKILKRQFKDYSWEH